MTSTPSQQPLQPGQCLGDGGTANGVAIAGEMEDLGDRTMMTEAPGDPDRADWLVLASTGRAGDAGDGDGQIGA